MTNGLLPHAPLRREIEIILSKKPLKKLTLHVRWGEGTTAEIKKRKNVHWIPVFFTYCLRSKYKTKSRKGKPHDFNINVEVKIKTVLPYELTCMEHEYIREEEIWVPTPVYAPVITTVPKFILKDGEEVIFPHPIDWKKFIKSKQYRYNIGRELFYILRGKGLTDKYGLRTVRTSAIILYSDILQILGYERLAIAPRVIKSIETTQLERIEKRIEFALEKVETIVKYESAEDFNEKLSAVMLEAIGDVVKKWFSNPLNQGGYGFDTPVDEDLVDDLEEGLTIDPICVLTTDNYILDEVENTANIYGEADVVFAIFERSNNFYAEPYPNDYWSKELENFVELHLGDIMSKLEEFYIEHVLEVIR